MSPLSPYLPVMEDREAEGLSLCMCTKVCLKPKRINGRDECLDGIERGAWHWSILCHMTSGRMRRFSPQHRYGYNELL